MVLGHLEVDGRNRVSVGVDERIAQSDGDGVFQRFANDVLQAFGLLGLAGGISLAVMALPAATGPIDGVAARIGGSRTPQVWLGSSPQ